MPIAFFLYQLSDGMLKDVWNKFGEHVLVILAVALVLALAGFFWKQLLSLYTTLFYPVPVHGEWNTEMTKDESQPFQEHETATVYQLGRRVWGETRTTAGGRKYRIAGRISGEKLSMVYRELTGVGLDAGAILLQIDQDGKTMQGYEIGCVMGKIISRQYRWKRR